TRIGKYSRSRVSIGNSGGGALPRCASQRADLLPHTDDRLAGATGLEPATSGVTGRRSNQLSYAPAASTDAGTPTLPSGGCQADPGRTRRWSETSARRCETDL